MAPVHRKLVVIMFSGHLDYFVKKPTGWKCQEQEKNVIQK